MVDNRPNIFIRFLLFIWQTIFGMVASVGKMLLNIVVMYAISYFGLQLYLDANPEKAAFFEQKKTMLISMLSQAETIMSAQTPSEEGSPAPEGMGAVANIVTPEMIQMAMGMMGEESTPAEKTHVDSNSIPKQLSPINAVLKSSKHYSKIRPRLTVAQAGENGEDATVLLDQLLGNKNQTIAKAAYNSLINVDTAKAADVLHKHGY